MKHHEKKYLKTELGSVKAVIPAAGAKIDHSFQHLLEDRPLAMLDINGKSLLQRNIETLNSAGIQDINVVVGYKGDKVQIDSAKIVSNREFQTTGIMHSVMKGFDEIADKNLIMYADIIIDRHLLETLLKKEGDIILVGDRSYKTTKYRNKKFELIVADNPRLIHRRTVDSNRKHMIKRIGNDIPENEGACEFVGIALLSNKGMQILIDEYQKGNRDDSISFVNFIQQLIDKTHEVLLYEVSDGWMEVHNFDDYKNACALFS